MFWRRIKFFLTIFKKHNLKSGARRVGLNEYPLKQAVWGGKRVFWERVFLRGGTGRNPTHTAPLPSLVLGSMILIISNFLSFSSILRVRILFIRLIENLYTFIFEI
jgi:hypothetical protein